MMTDKTTHLSRSNSAFFDDSKSISEKSFSPSPENLGVDELQQVHRRTSNVSFSHFPSPSENSSARKFDQIETPNGPIPRETALSSLSVQQFDHYANAPTWPKGWRPWACLLAGFLLMFNSWGIVNTYGTYANYYKDELLPGRDLMLFNLVGSTQSFFVLALSAIVGRFLDAGYHKHLIATGLVLVSLGSFTLSVSSGDGGYNDGNYGAIWATQGFVTGLGMACFFVTSSQVVATWFIKKKGLAIGLVASGASISGLVYPYMSRTLFGEIGFNNATRAVAGVICGTCIIAWFLAIPNPEHKIRKPDVWTIDVFWDKHAFKENKSYLWFVASISFLFFGFYAVFFNLEEWAQDQGLGPETDESNIGANVELLNNPGRGKLQTFWLLAIMNATSTIGRVGSAYLCDLFGALNVHFVVTLIASLLVLILWSLATTFDAALAFVIVFGAFSGAVIGLPPASVANILGPKHQSKLGQWTGMMYSCAAISALTGPVIAGHLITEYSTYLTVQLWSGFCIFLSALCMGCSIWCRERTRKAEAKAENEEAKTPV